MIYITNAIWRFFKSISIDSIENRAHGGYGTCSASANVVAAIQTHLFDKIAMAVRRLDPLRKLRTSIEVISRGNELDDFPIRANSCTSML